MASVQKKMQRSTKQQIAYLCEYMHSNAAFAAGDYRTPLGAANIDRQWAEIKTALDELGPHRSVEQWKLCWRDQKRKARVEGGAQNRAIIATGNSVAVPELSQNSIIILDTIGQEMAVGIGPDESPIGFCVPEFPTLPPQPSPPEPLLHPVPQPFLWPAPLPQPSSIPPPRPATIAQVKKVCRVRRENPPDRFINVQMELNGLIKELIEEVRHGNTLKKEHNNLIRNLN